MSRFRHILFIFIIFALNLGTSNFIQKSTAGEWKKLDGEPRHGECSLEFEGIINNGDLTYAIENGILSGSSHRICFNSPGGSFGEVNRFILSLEKPGDFENSIYFSTKIRKSDSCLSSCAILFMFGQSWGANSPTSDKLMEPGAKLGFHSPFIVDSNENKLTTSEAFQGALNVSQLLINRSYRHPTSSGPTLPLELVSIILGTPSDEMYYIDTFGELDLLGITSSLDWSIESQIDKSGYFKFDRETIVDLIKHVCASTYIFTFRNSYVSDGYSFKELLSQIESYKYEYETDIHHILHFESTDKHKPEKLSGVISHGNYIYPGWYSAGSALYCRVDLTIERKSDSFWVKYYEVDFGSRNFESLEDFSKIPQRSNDIAEKLAGIPPVSAKHEKIMR